MEQIVGSDGRRMRHAAMVKISRGAASRRVFWYYYEGSVSLGKTDPDRALRQVLHGTEFVVGRRALIGPDVRDSGRIGPA